MKLRYRYGWPLSRLAAKAGIPVFLKIDIIKDEEAGVFVATSPDLRGLVVEAESFEALVKETHLVISDLTFEPVPSEANMFADMHFQDRIAHA
ncbi:hypothetical protein BRN31_14915 [Xanthomonas oryzae pv. oryzae]|uniref:DUF1902 domain-containing protein n=1 Tax=Xanthomonas oryzae TaxID=347 RepID=UPI000DE0124E|nr:DUF1902 domain-containing protein [Xanthomonas oryzae]RBL28461.1 hypothetical protein BRN31_14915 [Xanthomonas oryzae pv. oryzae]RBL53371.1 hypothetical protein BRN24_18625 [Xanthomonas oryzae pv. oryzae]